MSANARSCKAGSTIVILYSRQHVRASVWPREHKNGIMLLQHSLVTVSPR